MKKKINANVIRVSAEAHFKAKIAATLSSMTLSDYVIMLINNAEK